MTWLSTPRYHIRIEDVVAIQVAPMVGSTGYAVTAHSRHAAAPAILERCETEAEAKEVAEDLVTQIRAIEDGKWAEYNAQAAADEMAKVLPSPISDRPLGPKAQAVLVALRCQPRSVEEVAHVIAAPPSYLHEHAVILMLQKAGAIEREPEGFRITEQGLALLTQAEALW